MSRKNQLMEASWLGRFANFTSNSLSNVHGLSLTVMVNLIPLRMWLFGILKVRDKNTHISLKKML